MNKNYKKLFLMLLVSFVIMYVAMFFNVVQLDHVYISLTRLYMAILMVMPMALVMLIFMRVMYKNKKVNLLIIVLTLFIFVSSFFFLRYQVGIDDVQYMEAMIPHHSSAILTSKNASIKDPEVRELADQIIETQEKEIAQMQKLISKLKNK